MKPLLIIARSEAGRKALQTHITESQLLPKLHKIHLRALGWQQEVTSTNPLTLKVSLVKKPLAALVDTDDVKAKIVRAMTANGAVYLTDYEFMVA